MVVCDASQQPNDAIYFYFVHVSMSRLFARFPISLPLRKHSVLIKNQYAPVFRDGEYTFIFARLNGSEWKSACISRVSLSLCIGFFVAVWHYTPHSHSQEPTYVRHNGFSNFQYLLHGVFGRVLTKNRIKISKGRGRIQMMAVAVMAGWL